MLIEEKRTKLNREEPRLLILVLNGMLIEVVLVQILHVMYMGLNPCSNGMLIELMMMVTLLLLMSLNPCSNGMLIE